MESFDKQLVAAMTRKREAEGLSLRSLSTVVGISFSSLARIERGEGVPDNNSKIRLLEWLGSDAEAAGLSFDNVAFVHFRAAKNVASATIQSLLKAAECIRRDAAVEIGDSTGAQRDLATPHAKDAIALSKAELEIIADRFREDLQLASHAPLDSRQLNIEGVQVLALQETKCLTPTLIEYLRDKACEEWSAMSVPLSATEDKWAVLFNDCHTVERQRVTLLEEFWHILLGHKLTKIARVAESYGRTYEQVEEHDAYYLASATLLPKSAIESLVTAGLTAQLIADRFGTSPELVDYRIKRLGLWPQYIGKKVTLSSV